MSQVPLYFDVVTQQRETEDGKQVLQSIVGIAGVPLMHRVVEVTDPENEAATSEQSIQERQQVAGDFALTLREVLIKAEQLSLPPAPEPDDFGNEVKVVSDELAAETLEEAAA